MVFENKIFKGHLKILYFSIFKVLPKYCKGSFTIILTNYDGLDLDNILAQYEVPPSGCFRGEVKNEIWLSSHNFMTNVAF